MPGVATYSHPPTHTHRHTDDAHARLCFARLRAHGTEAAMRRERRLMHICRGAALRTLRNNNDFVIAMYYHRLLKKVARKQSANVMSSAAARQHLHSRFGQWRSYVELTLYVDPLPPLNSTHLYFAPPPPPTHPPTHLHTA